MITIVDYQMGNLRSVQKGVERVGHAAQITSDPKQILAASHLILPGVGGFGEAMQELRRRDLVEPICDYVRSGKPFLGICLGLQLLFETGTEGGEHAGLGLLKGDVVRFDRNLGLKVPHMGWNTVTKKNPGKVLEGVDEGSHFYFVHSYYVRPADPEVIALECDYGIPFCAAVAKDNLVATQFHPEKSQANGLRLLESFTHLQCAGAAS